MRVCAVGACASGSCGQCPCGHQFRKTAPFAHAHAFCSAGVPPLPQRTFIWSALTLQDSPRREVPSACRSTAEPIWACANMKVRVRDTNKPASHGSRHHQSQQAEHERMPGEGTTRVLGRGQHDGDTHDIVRVHIRDQGTRRETVRIGDCGSTLCAFKSSLRHS